MYSQYHDRHRQTQIVIKPSNSAISNNEEEKYYLPDDLIMTRSISLICHKICHNIEIYVMVVGGMTSTTG